METSHRQAEQRAAEWLSRRDGVAWSDGDQLALDEWLEESAVHAVAFIRLEAAWSRADRYKALGAGFVPRQVPEPEQLSASPFFNESTPVKSLLQALIDEQPAKPLPLARRRTGWRLAAAACLVLAIAGSFMWHAQAREPFYSTPVGGLVSVPMKDGSRVTLNTDSKIRIHVTDKERAIQLDRGEAFFEVAKDPARPFVVNVGQRRIVVLGTQFSVRRQGADVQVLVTEGKVRLEAAAPKSSASQGARHSENEFLLEAGGVARTAGAGVLVASKPLTEVKEALSWRLGMVVFRNVNLAEAAAEFNRYNEQKILIEDPAIRAIRLSGKFKPTNSAAFVRLLEDGFPIEARERDGHILLTPRL
jgi:transmembrane sensor